jgi:hypothetical protein
MERVIRGHMHRQTRGLCGCRRSEYRFRYLSYSFADPHDLRVADVTVPET